MAQVNDMLSEFADISAAAQQFDYLEKRIEAYIEQMERANKAGKIAFDGLQATKTLSDLSRNAGAAAESNKKATTAVKDYSQAVEEANAFLSKLSDTMRDNVKQEVSLERQLSEVKKQLRELRNDSGDYTVVVEKLTAEEVALKVALSEVRVAMKQEEKEMQASAGSVDELSIKVGRLKDAWRQLDATERNSEGGVKLLSEIQVLDEVVKDLDASIGNFYRNVGNYPDATAQLREIRKELIALQLAGKGNSSEFEELTAKARKLSISIAQVNSTIGGASNATATTSSNFQKASNAAYSFQQVLRETPAAAYSFSTYMSAISNNVPILIQHLKELKTANIAAKAAGEATIPTWKVLAQSLFSLNGIATIAVSAFTIFTARTAMSGNAMSETDKAAQNLNKSMQELNETIRQSYDTEVAKTAELLRIAQSLSEPYKARIDAIQELIHLYPALLQSIDQEAFLLGKLGNVPEVLNRVVEQQNRIKSVEEELNLLVKERTKAKIELEKAQKDEGNSIVDLYNSIAGNDPYKEQKDSIIQYSKRIEDLKDDVRILKTELQFMLNPKHDGRILSDIDSDIKKFQALRDANAANTEEHKRAITELKKLEEERRRFLDKPLRKGGKDNSLKYEQDYTRELYGEYAKRLQIEAEYYKVVYENDKLSMEQRITAYKEYSDLSFQSQAAGLSALYDMTAQALSRIESIEKKSADKRTQQEKDLLAQKSMLQQRYNNISAEYSLLELEHTNKTAKGILAIQEDETKKRLESIKHLTNNVELEEAQAQNALSDQLQAGGIKYSEYVRKRKDLDDKYQKEKQQQTVDYLREEIDLLSRQGVNTTSLQEALNEAQKRLYDADLQNFIRTEQKKAEARKQINGKIQELVTETIQTIQAFNDAAAQKELNSISERITALDDKKNQEISFINQSLLSDEEKNKRVRIMEAQYAEEKRKIQQEEARIKRNQAIADKAAAGAQIIYGTSVAIVNALKIPPPAGQILAGVIAGIGAVQLARVASAQIPEYWQGTPPGGHPEDGLARVGERGSELIKEPGKAPYIVSSDQYRYLPKGTHVYNQEMLENDMSMLGGVSPAALRMAVNPNGDLTMQYMADQAATIQAYREESKAIRSAIENKSETQFIFNNGEVRKVVKRGHNWTKYIGDFLNE